MVSSVVSSWWYRPVRDTKDGRGPCRIGWISSYDYQDESCRPLPLPVKLASSVITFLTVSASCAFLYLGGSYRIIEDKHYHDFLHHVRYRDSNVPLITVSNHRSLLDDPLVLSALLPFWMNCQPRYLRWGACAQEICFKEEHLLATFFGVGKSLPMWRGGGIDQPLLLQLARKAVGCPETHTRADWLHVYPEAGVFQHKNSLGGRRNGKQFEIGKFKWGVGKLIAHNPSNKMRHVVKNEEHNENTSSVDVTDQWDEEKWATSRLASSSSEYDSSAVRKPSRGPVVIPFYFVGTESITPLHPVTRLLKSVIPNWGHKVVVRFGPAIEVGDLIDEFEEEDKAAGGGGLRVYHCCGDPNAHSSSSKSSRCDFRSLVNSVDNMFSGFFRNSSSIDSGDVMESPDNSESSSQIDESLLMYDSDTWKSTNRERMLYHKITSRIEKSLQRLCDQCAAD